jgi:hypothetical protein
MRTPPASPSLLKHPKTHGPNTPLKNNNNTQENSAIFASRTADLRDALSGYVASVERQAARVEAEKLRAIGLRNRVAALREARCLCAACAEQGTP